MAGESVCKVPQATAIGQMRYNHDMSRDISSYVSGGDSKKQIDVQRLGLFHSLHEDCVTALIAMAKKKSAMFRKCFQKSIDERRQRRQDKIKQAEMKEEEGAQKSLIDAWFLHKQFFSPACWDTVDKAKQSYSKLTTKKDKLERVKEQILMRYIGLGWEDAHHPWSYQGRAYTPDELFNHLVNTVIPLQEIHEAPVNPPVILPSIGDNVIIGTKSSTRKTIDESRNVKGEELRDRVADDISKMEDEGMVDAVEYMQETAWPLERILAGGFRIQVCYKYYDENDATTETLQWCTGVIEEVIRDKSEKYNQVEVEVKWDMQFVEPGMGQFTRELLKKSNWNPPIQRHGAWREDLDYLRHSSQI